MTAAHPTPKDDYQVIESFARDEDPRAAHTARARAWFGWRPSSATRCPRALAGKRCTNLGCICTRLYHPLLDHPRRWTTAEGEPILTADPYHFDGEDFTQLAAECAQLGLSVTVRGLSPYFPGEAMLVIIRRENKP